MNETRNSSSTSNSPKVSYIKWTIVVSMIIAIIVGIGIGAKYVQNNSKSGGNVLIENNDDEIAILPDDSVKLGFQFEKVDDIKYLTKYDGDEEEKEITLPDTDEVGEYAIADSAFKDNTTVTKITIPDGVTSIGNSAFSGCVSLKNIIIPDSVTMIGDSAFSNCTSLTSVTLGNGVTTIGSSAFSGCTSLTSIAIPDRVVSIGDYAFYDCSNLQQVTIEGNVTELGDKVFFKTPTISSGNIVYNTKLSTLTISVGVTSLPSNLFDYGNLNTVSTIVNNATLKAEFMLPTSVYRLKLKSNNDSTTTEFIYVSTTGTVDEEFNSSETTVIETTVIEEYLWIDTDGGRTSGLQTPKTYSRFNKDKIYQTEENDWQYLFDSAKSKWYIVGVPTVEKNDNSVELTIPAKITLSNGTEIDVYGIKSTSPNTAVTNLSKYAKVTLSDGIEKIEEYAFYLCKSLTQLTINGDIQVGSNAFYLCNNLTTLDIALGVTGLPQNLFDEGNLSAITTINNGATFEEEQPLPEEYVWLNADSGTVKGLKYAGSYIRFRLDIVNTTSDGWQYSYDTETGKHYIVGVPELKTENSKKELTIPNTLEIIEGMEVDIYGVKSLSSGSAMTNVSQYSSVIISEGIDEIGYDAFYNCKTLSSVTLNGNLITVDKNSLFGCSNATLIIGSNVTSVPTELMSHIKSVDNNVPFTTQQPLPENLVWVGSDGETTSLTNVGTYLAFTKNTIYTTSDGWQYLYDSVESKWYIVGVPSVEQNDDSTELTISATLTFSNGGEVDVYGIKSVSSEVIDTVDMWCSAYNGHLLEDAYLNVIYDDCNVFGTVLKNGDEEEVTGLNKHSEANVPDATVALFDELGELFAAFMGNITVNDSFTKLNPQEGSDAYNAYSQFFDKADELFDSSNVSIASELSYKLSTSAVIGINQQFAITFGNNVSLEYSDLQTVISRLFGYSAVDTFTQNANKYAKYIVDEYVTLTEKIENTELGHINTNKLSDNRCDYCGEKNFNSQDFNSQDKCNTLLKQYFDGSIYTNNGSFVLPFMFQNESSTAVLAYVIVNANGDTSIWFSDLSAAFKIANVQNGVYNPSISNAFTDVTVYGRCRLFEIPHKVEITTVPTAMTNISGYSSVTISEGIEEIGASTFENCSALTTVNLPSTLKSIGAYAFYQSGLTELSINGNVESVDSTAFVYCLGLETLNIGENVTSLPKDLFKDGNLAFVSTVNNSATFENEQALPSRYTWLNEANEEVEGFTLPGKYTAKVTDSSPDTDTPESGEQADGINLGDIYKIDGWQYARDLRSGNYYIVGVPTPLNSDELELKIPSSLKNSTTGEIIYIYGLYGIKQKKQDGKYEMDDDGYFVIGLTNISKYKKVTISDGIIAIGYCSFANYKKSSTPTLTLTSIEIPSSVTSIGEKAFYNLNNTTIMFAEGSTISTLGAGAFYGCTGLTSITLAEGMTEIARDVFMNCTKLSSIEIPSTITTIRSNAFYNCGNTMITFAEGSTISTLGAGAFYGCIGLTSITLAEGMTEIARDVFMNCTNLSDVKLPSTITTIRRNAFRNCTSFTTIELLSNILIIEDHAFINCENVTTLNIEGNLTAIGVLIFNDCSKLKTLNIGENVTSLPSNLFEIGNLCCVTTINNKATLEETLVLPADYIWIDEQGETVGLKDSGVYLRFNKYEALKTEDGWQLQNDGTNWYIVGVPTVAQNKNSKDLTIPTSLTVENGGTIGIYGVKSTSSEMENISEYTSVTITEGIVEIGSYAFYNCKDLTLSVPSSVTAIGDWALYNCKAKITFAEGCEISSLGLSSFRDCTALTSITLAEGLTAIPENAFSGCASPTNITVPASVTTVGENAFYDCKSTITFAKGSKISSIGSGAFHRCTGLEAITLNEGIVEIPNHAFDGCNNLESIVIPSSVTVIGNYAFNGCVGLKIIEILSNVTSIGSSAFEDCTASITFAEGSEVSNLGESAFFGSTGLKSITLAEGLTEIPNFAFYNCAGLSELTINGNLTAIGTCAFDGCTALTGLTLDENVTALPSDLFSVLINVTTINNNGVFETEYALISGYTWVFEGEDGVRVAVEGITAKGKYLRFSKDTTEDGWTYLYRDNEEIYYIIGVPNIIGVPSLDEENNTEKNLIIPSKLTTVSGDEIEVSALGAPNALTAVENLEYYTSVTISDGITSIGSRAFLNCTALTELTLNGNLLTIGMNAFYGCVNLKKLNVGKDVTTLPSDLFSTSLTNVTAVNINGTLETEIALPTKYVWKNEDGDIVAGLKNLGEYTLFANKMTTTEDGWQYYWDSTESKWYIGQVPTLDKESNTEKKLTVPNTFTNEYGSLIEIYGLRNYSGGCVRNLGDYKTVTISEGIEVIGKFAFYQCSGLTSIELPSSVTTLKYGALYNVGAVDLTVKSDIVLVEENALYGCNGTLHISEEVTSVLTELSAKFELIDNLATFEAVQALSSSYVWLNESSESVSGLTTAGKYVRFSKNKTYTTASGWAYQTDGTNWYIVGVPTIAQNKNSKVLTIPNELTLDNDLRIDIYGIKSITYLSGMTNVSAYTEVTISEGIVAIGNQAFYGCSSLTSITFADTATWYYVADSLNWSNKNGGTEIDVTLASTNSTYFTSTYKDYYWYKL